MRPLKDEKLGATALPILIAGEKNQYAGILCLLSLRERIEVRATPCLLRSNRDLGSLAFAAAARTWIFAEHSISVPSNFSRTQS